MPEIALRGVPFRVPCGNRLHHAGYAADALELLATLSVAVVALFVGLRLVDGIIDLRTGLFAIVLAPEAYLPPATAGPAP